MYSSLHCKCMRQSFKMHVMYDPRQSLCLWLDDDLHNKLGWLSDKVVQICCSSTAVVCSWHCAQPYQDRQSSCKILCWSLLTRRQLHTAATSIGHYAQLNCHNMQRRPSVATDCSIWSYPFTKHLVSHWKQAIACPKTPAYAVYLIFFFGRNWFVCPHFFLRQLVARGCSLA